MCGRAAQSLRTANEAASRFQAVNKDSSSDNNPKTSTYNLSPGMNAAVMWKDDDGQVVMDNMGFGLITRGGSKNHPIPSGKQRMNLMFQNLMFNARSDTLFSKPTFARLLAQKKSCIIALDGYFEWKQSLLPGDKGKKQPYFVYSKNGILVAGLWTEVYASPDEPNLRTFTILTTEPSKQIEWLHDRMPVCLWDHSSAMKWLTNPSAAVLKTLDDAARKKNDGFSWHMVSPEMSDLKFQGEKVIKPIKPPASVLSFFTSKQNVKDGSTPSPATSKRLNSSKSNTSSPKRLKGGSGKTETIQKKESTPQKTGKNLITGFFQKKA